jgi:glycosyltransferase involved in cell wall biosynthesis
MSKRTIDVVIPAFNEEACIGRAIETLFAKTAGSSYRFELIIVDDGSADRTAEIVASYLDRYPITLVRLTRNFGKETALLAGLDQARGDATIIMDADLQHPVDLIERFIALWEEGYECVYGMKEHRRNESFLKRFFTRIFYLGINRGSGVKVVPNALDFRLLDRAAVRALCALRERVRFTKGLYAWLGFRSIGVPFVPAERAGGQSHFGGRSLIRLGWDGWTSFSDLPLKFSGVVGAIVATASVGYGIWITVRTWIFGVDLPGWATLTVAITFLSGLQLLFLGVLGQYVRNVFIETKNRPNYLVREVVHSAAVGGVGTDEDGRKSIDTSPSRAGRIAAV